MTATVSVGTSVFVMGAWPAPRETLSGGAAEPAHAMVVAGYRGACWAVDLCFWPGAWEETT